MAGPRLQSTATRPAAAHPEIKHKKPHSWYKLSWTALGHPLTGHTTWTWRGILLGLEEAYHLDLKRRHRSRGSDDTGEAGSVAAMKEKEEIVDMNRKKKKRLFTGTERERKKSSDSGRVSASRPRGTGCQCAQAQRHPEIKSKKTQTQYKWYRGRVFSCLISQCSTVLRQRFSQRGVRRPLCEHREPVPRRRGGHAFRE
eukprot:1273354-Rhodomonas_salina.1